MFLCPRRTFSLRRREIALHTNRLESLMLIWNQFFWRGMWLEEAHMPEDRNAYAAHARRCLELAAETLDPVVKQNLVDAAQRWTRIASELAVTSELHDGAETASSR